MKEYEVNYEKPPINFLVLFFIAIIVISVWFYITPIISKPTTFNTPVIVNESKAIQIEYITVLVTPTPDGRQYYASEHNEGIRKIQNPYTFHVDNASGKKGLTVTNIVYDYKILNFMTWHNDIDNLYYRVHPHSGYKFLIVCYAMYIDDRVSDRNEYHIPSINNFIVTSISGDRGIFYPYTVPKQLSYLELENTYDFNNVEIIEYFGQHVGYSKRLDDKESGGIVSVSDNVLRAGKSNAESGYIIYQIPDDMIEDEIIAGVNFGAFGNAFWRLKP